MSISKNPAFNLKAVLHETNIVADTLRAWERRYGLPAPQRTAGGHRLYSQYDIETIKWLLARQAEGLSISRAVDSWNEKIAFGLDPLAGSVQKNLLPPSAMNLEAVRRDWLKACFQYDTVLAEQILNQALAVHSVEITCTEVIMRGLYEVGELWHKGKASVQQEHFASGIAMRRLEALINAAPPATRSKIILVACPPDEWHAFPLLLTTLLLRRRGWNVAYLGANVPIDRLEEAMKAIHPKLVILSSQTLTTAVTLREMARLLNRKGIQTAFGGRVFNHITGLSQRIPAHFLGSTIESSIPAIESLLANPVPAPKEEAINKRALHIAEKYKQKRSHIETTLVDNAKARNQTIDHIDAAIHFLGTTMSAALELGSITYLSTEIDWLINLLSEYRVSLALLPIFLNAYSQAARGVMGGDSKVIQEWLALEARKLEANQSKPS